MCVCTAYRDLISRQHAAKPRLSSERDSNALGALTGKGVVDGGGEAGIEAGVWFCCRCWGWDSDWGRGWG